MVIFNSYVKLPEGNYYRVVFWLLGITTTEDYNLHPSLDIP